MSPKVYNLHLIQLEPVITIKVHELRPFQFWHAQNVKTAAQRAVVCQRIDRDELSA